MLWVLLWVNLSWMWRMGQSESPSAADDGGSLTPLKAIFYRFEMEKRLIYFYCNQAPVAL